MHCHDISWPQATDPGSRPGPYPDLPDTDLEVA
jgi:hypothetical protein